MSVSSNFLAADDSVFCFWNELVSVYSYWLFLPLVTDENRRCARFSNRTFLGEPMNRPACLRALLPCVCPGNGLDHLCLCLSHIPCGFMCRHINMEQQTFMDKFLAAGRSRSNNQKTDFQSKTLLSSSWPKIWKLPSYYICIYAHEYVHVSNVHEVTYIHVMPVHSVWFSGRMCILPV